MDVYDKAVEEFGGLRWGGFREIGGARSTNMRHHSSSNFNCSLFERRNRYEPTHSIPFPRTTHGL
jgi:hypothetical protein